MIIIPTMVIVMMIVIVLLALATDTLRPTANVWVVKVSVVKPS